MKKIGLLTTLLVAELLLTGCNNNVHYEEEFSEYGLVHWPNGTITLEDFEKEGNILIELNIEQCNSPEKACVPVIVKEDGNLYTPYEYNETPYDDKKDRYTYYTDLETFHKVTGLKEATSEYVEGSNNVYFFDPYVKFYKTNEEREAILKKKIENQTIEEENTEKTVEDNKDITDIGTLIKTFTGNILNGSHRETFVITGDNTLYYNDEFGFAMKLGKEWNGAKIEIITLGEDLGEENEWQHYPMIDFSKPKIKEDWPMDWYSILRFPIITKILYEKAIELSKGEEMCDEKCFQEATIGHNNKYYFQLGYTNMAHSDVYDLFQGQLDCKLNYPEGEEWNYPWLPWNCSEALPGIVPEYYFYPIISNLPSI